MGINYQVRILWDVVINYQLRILGARLFITG